MEHEGAGSYESVVMETGDFTSFGHWIGEHRISWSEVKQILGTEDLSKVSNWIEALVKIKEAKGIK